MTYHPSKRSTPPLNLRKNPEIFQTGGIHFLSGVKKKYSIQVLTFGEPACYYFETEDEVAAFVQNLEKYEVRK